MKLEFLSDLTAGGRYKHVVSERLVRLYDFNRQEATKLRAAILEEVITHHKALSLSSLDFIQSLNSNLTFRISHENVGITTTDGMVLFLDQTIEQYKEMLNLMEPFCESESSGYQWLIETCEIDLLFSPGGTW
ncbi:MAG: hypothetical protein ACHQRM_02015 [Bacteroidia bacterium]